MHQLQITLECPFYVDGHLVWRHRDGEGGWKKVRSEQPVVNPVIPRETWEKAQTVNQQRRQAPKTPSPGRVDSVYVLFDSGVGDWLKTGAGEPGLWYSMV